MSGAIKLPGGAGTVVHLGTAEETDLARRTLEARYAFTISYCKSKGWPEEAEKLSFDQIFEIRDQEGWKNPRLDGG